MPLNRSFPTWERTAYDCGAEACANGRKAMTPDDKLDVALAYGEEAWIDLPSGVRDIARNRWIEGWRAEEEAEEEIRYE